MLDQVAKLFVLRFLGATQERVVVAGFFKFVHWENTGAAWSLFHERNVPLAAVSALALIGLYSAGGVIFTFICRWGSFRWG